MAIQIPNPGTGNGATGDNEFVLWSKVKDNFSDKTHAASKLVGVGEGLIPTGADVHKANNSYVTMDVSGKGLDIDTQPLGEVWTRATPSTTSTTHYTISHMRGHASSSSYSYQLAYGYVASAFLMRVRNGGTWGEWVTFYSTRNTTKEAGTGYLMASSPVLKMQHDSFEKVHEAEQLDIEVKNIETGVYEIIGATGLREDDGWNLKPPKDINGNVLCICEATEKDGVITLKTYKKKFDFETVSIVADYEQPTDIPEGATVMLRFNDFPQENLDDIQTEEVDLDK